MRASSRLWELFRKFGSLRVMYAIAEVLDLGGAVPPRPLLPLPPAERRQVELTVQGAAVAH